MVTSKVWFITGCSSGFGKELALGALKRSDKVIATARNASKPDDLMAAGASTMDWDVGGLEELTHEEAQAQFATNFLGMLNTTHALVPYLRAHRSGVVANVSSVGTWRGCAGVGLYCASKWAVSGLSETLYYGLADFNIKACTIEPGYFRSNFLSPGNKLKKQNLIPDYEGTAIRKGEKLIDECDNKQPDDIKKGVKVIVDFLAGDSGREIPTRLVLGVDAYGMIKAKCEETIKGWEWWKDLTCSTDLDEK